MPIKDVESPVTRKGSKVGSNQPSEGAEIEVTGPSPEE